MGKLRCWLLPLLAGGGREGGVLFGQEQKHPSPALPCKQGREIKSHTDRVATTGGTAAARRAGPSTASWPIIHNATAPTGK
ncbi:hypothetical protein GCM10009126_01360 [Rhodanobacter caeni]|uniref:Secreted protein n=1 Tax=Rhodanobacter caeni TaxID=657654 RepID=A0ABN0U5L6_9GAMM